ncbi:Bromodomain-containing protein [Nesidiocoris tenuis]|uniref:Bromodomain-containing protein n=1 Tax=Nesidiocoris tenuis TaxID=355587 RepID=A0ABN7B676_9HEMI|nr:Bromodomain-containing protein [Nesidiocoris tenuis]
MPRPLGSKNKKPRKTPEKVRKKLTDETPKKTLEETPKKSPNKSTEKTPKKAQLGEKLRSLLQSPKQLSEKKPSLNNLTSDGNETQSSSSRTPSPEKKLKPGRKREKPDDTFGEGNRSEEKEKDFDVKPKIKRKRRKKDADSSRDDCFSSGGEESAVSSPAKTPARPEFSFWNESFTGREPRTCVQIMRQKQIRSPLIKTLDYFQRQLEEKDPQQYFAWPVTDQIAPGYSKMIKKPMDFSTMKQKIEDDSYKTLPEYADDFKRMCDNAMTYNRSDSVYFKTAKKLLRGGMKLLSQEKVEKLAPYLKFIYDVPKEQLGFEIKVSRPFYENQAVSPRKRDSTDGAASDTPGRKTSRLTSSDSGAESKAERSAVEDSETEPEQTPVKKLTEVVAQLVELDSPPPAIVPVEKPNIKVISRRQDESDGTTTLAIVVPKSPFTYDQEKIVTIGQTVGKLSYGTATLQGLGGDRRRIRAVRPLYYGAFTSYAPTYDSTFATISKEDTDMIYELYSDENSFLYVEKANAESINFAKKGDYALDGVDNLLDLVSGGEYRRSLNAFREPTPEDDVVIIPSIESLPEHQPNVNTPALHQMQILSNVPVEIDQLKSLADLGIDMSFLDKLDEHKIRRGPDPIQDRLEHATALIDRLQKIQNERLAFPTPGNLNYILQPSDMEVHLAQMLTESLADLVKRVTPRAVVSVPAVRKAMGMEVNYKDVSTVTEPEENYVVESDEDEPDEQGVEVSEESGPTHPKPGSPEIGVENDALSLEPYTDEVINEESMSNPD